jgi:hypothetical protein
LILDGETNPPRHALQFTIDVFVADDDPERTGVFQDALALREDRHQGVNVLRRSRLAADLRRAGFEGTFRGTLIRLRARVFPLPKIGGAGDDAIDRSVRDFAQNLDRVAAEDLIENDGSQLRHGARIRSATTRNQQCDRSRISENRRAGNA